MEHTFWIWYPGDFELYHGMKQNFGKARASATALLFAAPMSWSRRQALPYFQMQSVMCW